MDDTVNPKLVICDNLKGGKGRNVGGRLKGRGHNVYLMPVHSDVW